MPSRGLHPLLSRQVLRNGGTPDAPPTDAHWRTFLGKISSAYRDAEDDRYLLERSLDISSREMQELSRRLSAERNQLRALLSSIGDGVAALDADGRITWANPAAAEVLGVCVGGLTGFQLLNLETAVDRSIRNGSF